MEKYNLIGFANWFSVVPGFVTPIFIKDKSYYTMNVDPETNETSYIRVPYTYNDSVVLLDDLAVDYLNIKGSYTEEDEIIGAFQMSEGELVIGQLDLLVKILKEYEAENRILQKEIDDYINEIEFYMSVRNRKKGSISRNFKRN